MNDVLLTFFKGPTLGEEDSCFSSQNNIYFKIYNGYIGEEGEIIKYKKTNLAIQETKY